MVDQRDPRRPTAWQGRLQCAASQLEPGHKAFERAVRARRERLRALLRRSRVHPHEVPAVAMEVEEAA